MGRPTAGWKLRAPKEPGGNYTVRFTHPKTSERIERSTGKSDPREAAEQAALIYARALTIGAQPGKRRVDPFLTLDELFAMCLADMSKIRDVETVQVMTLRAKRFVDFFGNDLMNVHRARMADYQRERLTKVERGTLRKEQSVLSVLLTWLVEQNVMTEENVPAWPHLDAKVLGTRSGAQRAKPVDLTPEQVKAFLLALPLWSKKSRHTGRPVPVRARFVFAYETGLRPATLDAIRVGTHWRRDAAELVITPDVDKSRYGRTVPLTELAIAALAWTVEACALADGELLFGAHDYRERIKAAARAAGLPRAADVAAYDLRHGRAGHLVDESRDMRGAAFLIGHLRLTTTDRYLRAQERNALSLVSAQDRSGGVLGGGEEMLVETEKEASKSSVGRTGLEPVRVTPLVPETSANAGFLDGSEAETGPERTRKVLTGQSSGGIPETLRRVAEGMVTLRTGEAALEQALASELLVEVGEES